LIDLSIVGVKEDLWDTEALGDIAPGYWAMAAASAALIALPDDVAATSSTISRRLPWHVHIPRRGLSL